MCEVLKKQQTHCLRNEFARKGLTKILKSKKGHNSVKIQIRVMGLGIQGHLMTVITYVKFQSNSVHTVSEKRTCTQRFDQLARKGLTKILKSKNGHNSVKIELRVMGLGIQGNLFTLNKSMKVN